MVDRFDLDYTENSIEASIDSYSHDYFGAGTAQTPEFPNGLVPALSGSLLQGTVTAGVAYDPLGNRIRVATTQTFTIPANPSNPRWDLVVLRYKKTGDTPVPKPSDPITTIFLNLHDDYDLVYLPGTPSGSPAYPATLTNDVILVGVQCPVAPAVGTDCTLDETVRVFAVPPASRLLRKYFATVIPFTGRAQWAIPQAPADPLSYAVFVDGVPQDVSEVVLDGMTLTFDAGSIPVLGQEVFVLLLVGQTGAMAQAANTVPNGKMISKRIGTGDGVTTTFTLPFLPVDSGSVAAVVDGAVADDDEFNVVGQTIVFTAGNIPALGQGVAVLFLTGATSILGIISSDSGISILSPYGTRSTPLVIVPTVTIAVAVKDRQIRFVVSNGGATPVTAVPQVAPGTIIGQELELKGRSDTDYLQLADGNGLDLSAPIDLKAKNSLTLVWDGGFWAEKCRI